MPAGHVGHVVAPVVEVWPPAAVEHEPFPAWHWYFPAGQSLQHSKSGESLAPMSLYFPPGQLKQLWYVLVLCQYLPGGQGVASQSLLVKARLIPIGWYFPAPLLLHEVQDALLVKAWYFPVGQALHDDWVVLAWYLPAGQVWQVVLLTYAL